jgi:hypothetical protein
MSIPFRKIGTTAQEFETHENGTTFKGSLKHYQRGLIMLEGHIHGILNVTCDICAENFDTILDEKLTFLLSDGIFNGHDENYDVVEFLDGTIEIDELLTSELESIRSDYHRCPGCQQ